MRAVAEGLVLRLSAPAQRDHLSARQPEGLTLRIEDFEFSLDANRTVVIDRNSCIRHEEPILAVTGIWHSLQPVEHYCFCFVSVTSSPKVTVLSAPNRL